MRKNHPLAKKKSITRADLDGVPLLVSQQALASSKDLTDGLNIIGSYNLLYNAAIYGMAEGVPLSKAAELFLEEVRAHFV